MYCYNCGKQAHDKAVVCVNCGVALRSYESDDREKEKKQIGSNVSPNDWLFQFLAIISFALVLVVRVFSLRGDEYYNSYGYSSSGNLYSSSAGCTFMWVFALVSLTFGILSFVSMFRCKSANKLAPVLAFSLSICAIIVAFLAACGA